MKNLQENPKLKHQRLATFAEQKFTGVEPTIQRSETINRATKETAKLHGLRHSKKRFDRTEHDGSDHLL